MPIGDDVTQIKSLFQALGSFTNINSVWMKHSAMLAYGKIAFWVAGDFFHCNTLSGYYDKLASKLIGGAAPIIPTHRLLHFNHVMTSRSGYAVFH